MTASSGIAPAAAAAPVNAAGLDAMQTLCVLDAIKRAATEQARALKEHVDAEARAAGTESKRVSINGREVAVYRMTYSDGPVVTDADEFAPWAVEAGWATWRYGVAWQELSEGLRGRIVELVRDEEPWAVTAGLDFAEDFALKRWTRRGPGDSVLVADTGEVVPGCEWRTEPGYSSFKDPAKRTRAADPLLVAAALGGPLGGLVSGDLMALPEGDAPIEADAEEVVQ